MCRFYSSIVLEIGHLGSFVILDLKGLAVICKWFCGFLDVILILLSRSLGVQYESVWMDFKDRFLCILLFILLLFLMRCGIVLFFIFISIVILILS